MLDASQRRFVNSRSQRVRLLAPAGSGKTLSLLHRCARIGATAPAERFQLVTFTRAARNELVARLQRDDVFELVRGRVRVTTLNAWGFRQVKQSVNNASLLSNKLRQSWALNNSLQPVWQKYQGLSEVLSDSRRKARAGDAIFAVLESLKTLGFRHDQITKKHLDAHTRWLVESGMEAQITALLNTLSEIGLVNPGAPFVSEMRKEFIPFWVEATDTLHQQGLITFEDQKYWPYFALDKSVQEGKFLSGAARTHHVIVDEFQDINPLDLALIDAIVKQNKASLTLAGDDDQAIYEWRGASPEFILNPDKYFGADFRTFILETNYRSPQNIVRYSQRLIANNKGRVAKQVKAHQKINATVEVLRHSSIADCINETTALVQQLLNRDDIKSVALISRKRSQIIPYQITFASSNLPFYAAEDLNINLSAAFRELKEVLAIRGQQDHVSPFGPSPIELLLKLCDKVKRYPLSKADRASLLSHLNKSRSATMADAVAALRKYQGSLKGDNSDARMSEVFADSIDEFMTSETVADTLSSISSKFQGFQQDYGKSDDDIYYTDPPFFYLAALAERYGNRFADFYSDIETAMSQLAQVQSEVDENPDDEQLTSRLHLMTALRAKGREFDAVIVLDANNGIWPSKLAESTRALEQERRLFYVASTRPRRYLAYVYSDRLLDQGQVVSPYIKELGLRLPS